MADIDDGGRTIIHMPNGDRYYLLAFPYGEDAFLIKFPYENRPENKKERDALEEITRVINEYVRSIHEHYNEQLEEIFEHIEDLATAYCQECTKQDCEARLGEEEQ